MRPAGDAVVSRDESIARLERGRYGAFGKLIRFAN